MVRLDSKKLMDSGSWDRLRLTIDQPGEERAHLEVWKGMAGLGASGEYVSLLRTICGVGCAKLKK